MTANSALLLEIVPNLAPGELLFAVLVFAASICVLFNIHPEAILGATLLLAIITFVDFLGVSPLLAILVIVIAAFLRIIGTAIGSLEDTDPELLAILASIIGRDSAPDDRENT